MSGRNSKADVQRWRSEPAAFIEEVCHDPESGRSYSIVRSADFWREY
jgi:hypothetical protein